MKINESISRLQLEYKDIFTTIYTVRTPEGVLVFDAATTPEDITVRLADFLREEGIGKDEVKGVFISHNHRDHAGGLETFAAEYPEAKIYSRSEKLKEKYGERVISLSDGEGFMGVLQLVAIPGHTIDSAGVLDTRTKTLISGDCLQLYGIFGSGEWCANISRPDKHIKALEKLEAMEIERVLTAHDYHPCGWDYKGREEVLFALKNCREPLEKVKKLILEHPGWSDEEIAAEFNRPTLPRLGAHVATKIREYWM